MNPTSQPTQIGKYKILSELGRGGMGVVYRAEDRFIGREVAIKTLVDATPEMRQRFAIEARSGILNHPNIVTIYDFGEHDGSPYIVMEFLHGQTLERIVKDQHPLTLVERLDILRQVCEGLAYAHSRGVVHRDIKPANVVMLPNGCAKLVDFGIAQLETLSGHTMAGAVIGTYQYLSPERLKGEPSDGRADIWGAGVLLYLLLTGTLPFPGEDISALHRVITDPYPPLSTFLSTAYPASLDNIVARALAKDPAQRYPNALEMAGDLEATRDAIRLSRVEDLLGQARNLIDKDELLRARPLLLDLQRLAPQNTAVREMLRELQDRLSHHVEPDAHAPHLATEPASAAKPEADLPEEDRRRRIIDQIVIEIRAQADRGHEARALELVQRSLERAPNDAALLALQSELQARVDAAGTQAEAQTRTLPDSAVAPQEGTTTTSEVTVEPAPEDFAPNAMEASEGEASDHLSENSQITENKDEADLLAAPALAEPAQLAEAEATTHFSAAQDAQPLPKPAGSTPSVSGAPVAAELGTEAVQAVPPDLHSTVASAQEGKTSAVPVLSPLPLRADTVPLPLITKADTVALPSPDPVAAAQRGTSAAPQSSSPKSFRLFLLAGLAVIALLGVLLALSRHRTAPPAPAVTTYAQVMATPYAQVLRLTTEGNQPVSLPAGDHTTPLRVDGLQPGTYTLDLEQPGGSKLQVRCTISVQQHLCRAGADTLSDQELQEILNGGTHP